jgi:hypothetical protein
VFWSCQHCHRLFVLCNMHICVRGYIPTDPVLHELLAHYGLTDFEEAFAADEFGIENLLQIKTEDDWNGFCEHFEVSGFLFKNRFKTMIAAIPGMLARPRVGGRLCLGPVGEIGLIAVCARMGAHCLCVSLPL